MSIFFECFMVTARQELDRIANALDEARTDAERQSAGKRLEALGNAMAKQLVAAEAETKNNNGED